jgi:hypothetical protein
VIRLVDVISESALASARGRRQVAISKALAFQYVGLREQTDGRWLVSFMSLDLGTITNNTLTPI